MPNRIYIACGNGRDVGCGEINECLEGFQCVCENCGRTLRDGREEEPLEVFC
jgi:hypothetical protein